MVSGECLNSGDKYRRKYEERDILRGFMITVAGYIRVIYEDEMGETHSAHENSGDQ